MLNWAEASGGFDSGMWRRGGGRRVDIDGRGPVTAALRDGAGGVGRGFHGRSARSRKALGRNGFRGVGNSGATLRQLCVNSGSRVGVSISWTWDMQPASATSETLSSETTSLVSPVSGGLVTAHGWLDRRIVTTYRSQPSSCVGSHRISAKVNRPTNSRRRRPPRTATGSRRTNASSPRPALTWPAELFDTRICNELLSVYW